MRYRGQGHEIAVPVPGGVYTSDNAAALTDAFEAAYRRLYSRVIPGVEIEVLSWVVLLSAPVPQSERLPCPIPRRGLDPRTRLQARRLRPQK